MDKVAEVVAAQLRDELGRRADEVARCLAPCPPPEPVGTRHPWRRDAATAIATWLCSNDDDVATLVSIELVEALWPQCDAPLRWWRSPLGRVIARTLGHPTADSVSESIAALVLNTDVAEIDNLLSTGALEVHPDGGVTVASIAIVRGRA